MIAATLLCLALASQEPFQEQPRGARNYNPAQRGGQSNIRLPSPRLPSKKKPAPKVDTSEFPPTAYRNIKDADQRAYLSNAWRAHVENHLRREHELEQRIAEQQTAVKQLKSMYRSRPRDRAEISKDFKTRQPQLDRMTAEQKAWKRTLPETLAILRRNDPPWFPQLRYELNDGQVGFPIHEPKVLSVIDDKSAIVRYGGNDVHLSGIPMKDITDGSKLEITNVPFAVDGTYAFDTVLGARRTVMSLKLFEIPDH